MEQRTRHKMELREKLKIINLVEVKKMRVAHVARMYNRNESSIRQILRIKDKIKANATLYPHRVQVSNCPRKKLMLKVEDEIYKWLDDAKKDMFSPDANLISMKAVEIYDNLAKSSTDLTPDSKLFMASKNWVTKCLSRYEMRNSEPTPTPVPKSTPVPISTPLPTILNKMENTGTNPLMTDLERIFCADDFLPQQIFCVDELGLFWKKLPESRCKQEDNEQLLDSESSKDRMTLIMCGNAIGHFIKPAVVYRKQPDLENKEKDNLPVFWMSNEKMRMTATLFLDWFHQCFKPAVKSYLEAEELSFKVLLLVDKAPWHPVSLIREDEHIKIYYLPAPFNVKFQPMKQGILHTFKINYFKEVFEMLKNAHVNGEDIWNTWQAYSIVDALIFIHNALNKLETKCFIACWQNLPLRNRKQNPTKTTKKQDLDNLLKMAHKIPIPGLADMKMPELLKFLDAQDNLVNSVNSVNSADLQKFKETVPDWNIDSLDSTLKLAEVLKQQIKQGDANLKRSICINQQITVALKPLEILFAQLKRQKDERAPKRQKYYESSTNLELFNGDNEPQLEILNNQTDIKEEDPFLHL